MADNNGKQHAEVMLALGRIEAKVDSVFPTMARQRADHEELEQRVRSLENWRWYVVGIALAGATAAGLILEHILGG